MKFRLQFLVVILFFSYTFVANAQDRFVAIQNSLDSLAKTEEGLNQPIELSVNNVPLQEFIRAIGVNNGVNVSIKENLNEVVVNNFSGVKVKDVFVFLCKQYDLDIDLTGSILTFAKHKYPEEKKIYIPKKLEISYDTKNDRLNLDLKNDSLFKVVKEITQKSSKNVVISPNLINKQVSIFVKDLPFESAISKLAFANDLEVEKTEDKSFLIKKKSEELPEEIDNRNRRNKQKKSPDQELLDQAGLEIAVNNAGLTLNATNIRTDDIIRAVSNKMSKNFFLFSDINIPSTLKLRQVSYEDFLKLLLNGTDYTFKKEGDIYLIGNRSLERLRETKVVQLQNRTIEGLVDYIPTELKNGVSINAFPDLNSFILSGSSPMIEEIEAFLKDVDIIVPMVMIEVIIVDVRKNHSVSTGINAGLGDAPATTGGSIYPGIDFTLNSGSLNEIIGVFNGFGIFNLGKVTPNFYVSLKALEDQGIINTRSTPKLATLNGNEATLSIGNTEYYLELQNNVIGSQNPQNIISQNYKSVKADLSLSIMPIVSGDDQVTLKVTVKQSDFTGRASPDAPPGNISREFDSMIRVKNGEMIILGGLEEKSTNDTGRGLPLLSRIPIIKWFFSSRVRSKEKSRLNIFIKPTIIY